MDTLVHKLLHCKFRGTKNEYIDWERRAKKYVEQHGKEAIKRKWIVAAYLKEDLEKFNRNDVDSISSNQKWSLYHAGSETFENVSYGFDAEKRIFKLAATDTGGLTNAKLRTPADLKNSVKTKGNESARDLYKKWLELSEKQDFCCGKAFYAFETWLDQVRSEHNAHILFYKVKDERKKLSRAQEVKSAIGSYNVRTYKDDLNYATRLDNVDGLYSSVDVEQSFLVPNINNRNIENEYTFVRADGTSPRGGSEERLTHMGPIHSFIRRLKRLFQTLRHGKLIKSKQPKPAPPIPVNDMNLK